MADKKREASDDDAQKKPEDESKGQYGSLKSLGSGGGHHRDKAAGSKDNDPVDPEKSPTKPG